ncbi:MAG: hypothetical protein IT259_18370 [Saprospiraceae bacterium]|nr:hypothetical protein [Saprospiraceae bacterium]
MKNYWIFTLLLLAFAISGCKDDTPDDPANPAFNMNFHATYNGEHVVKFKAYDYDTMSVKWTRFNLYVSDSVLLKGSEEVPFSEIAYLNFTPDNASDNDSKTVNLRSTEIPAGDYTGIRIGFGVKPELNAKKPADYPTDHPLYNESEFWPGWSSYIFSKVEGSADTDKNGTNDLDLVYHTGGNQTYKVFTFNHPFTVGAEGGDMHISLDLKKLFTFDGQLFDIVAVPSSSHGQSGIDLMETLQDNYDNAVVFE